MAHVAVGIREHTHDGTGVQRERWLGPHDTRGAVRALLWESHGSRRAVGWGALVRGEPCGGENIGAETELGRGEPWGGIVVV